MWFTSAHRRSGRRARVANLYYDTDSTDWLFTPDLNRPAEAPEDLRSDGVRLTWAATSRQKVWFWSDYQDNDSLNQTGDLDSGTLAIEASERANAYCNDVKVLQGGWTHAATNHLLFDAGVSAMNNYYSIGFEDMGCGGNRDTIRILEQSTGFNYNGIINRRRNIAAPLILRGSSSYVKGQHNIKAGFDMLMTRKYVDYRERGGLTLPVSYRFNLGVPNRLTQYVTPRLNPAFVRPSLGMFAQDQWALGQMTLSLGLRYEYLRAYSGEIDQPSGFPGNTIDHYARVDCLPCWHDLSPRMAVAYNLAGNGKTAVKAGLGRYVESLNTGYATSFGPGASIVLNTNRTWGDADGDFFPDCDLTNLTRNGECGPTDNSSFGQVGANTVPDTGFMNGFGKRRYNWQASLGVDHELRPGVAISATYYRRWFGNFTVTDNTLVTPADFDRYLHHGAARSPARLDQQFADLRLVRHQSLEVRAGLQRRRPRGQVRRPLGGLQRLRSEPGRSLWQGRHVVRWMEYREHVRVGLRRRNDVLENGQLLRGRLAAAALQLREPEPLPEPDQVQRMVTRCRGISGWRRCFRASLPPTTAPTTRCRAPRSSRPWGAPWRAAPRT